MLLLVVLVIGSFSACVEDGPGDNIGDNNVETVDYVAELKLNMSSETLKQEVTVKTFVDGDTTHFNLKEAINGSTVLKARYLGINTPESTGKIEEYGKAAAAFTKEKLENASSIMVESDDGNWNIDSTGSRCLVWVWYKNKGESDYRNLNLEILQNGLCIASSTANNRYGDICMKALTQAKNQKLKVHSGEKDPDFYYGDAHELSLVELRPNIENYLNQKVAFEGVITLNNNNSVYVEEYDPDTGLYFGMSVYYGFSLNGTGLGILSVGNRVRIVGTVQYYEAGGTYQVSGLQYREMKPDDPSNIKLISQGHAPAYVETTAEQFTSGKVELELEEGKKTFDYSYLTMNTSISMKGLEVNSVYTTNNPESSSNGAMTLRCTVGGVKVDVRTEVFRHADGSLMTAEEYNGKNIDVLGIIDYFDGSYQIRVLTPNDIKINN